MRAHTRVIRKTSKGLWKPGKFADLVVWTTDPSTLSPEDLFNSTVDLTMVGGKIVFKRT
jgi:predicted amidohydrolase YtcJ